MAKLRIDVTQEDIDGAYRGDPYSCVVQRALAREIGPRFPDEVISVGYGDIELCAKEYQEQAGKKIGRVSKGTVQKMWRFDLGNKVKPFAMFVELFEAVSSGESR